MINATIYTDTLTAGNTLRKLVSGAFFKIISSTGQLNVRTDVVMLNGLVSGQGFEKAAYTFLELTDASGAVNTIRYIVATEGFLDGITGSMQITSQVPIVSASFAVTAPALTTASTQMVAANSARKYLLVQNNDSTASAYLNFGAAAVVGPASIKIGPGGVYEMSDVQTTQAINFIGSSASALITVVQG